MVKIVKNKKGDLRLTVYLHPDVYHIIKLVASATEKSTPSKIVQELIVNYIEQQCLSGSDVIRNSVYRYYAFLRALPVDSINSKNPSPIKFTFKDKGNDKSKESKYASKYTTE